MAASCLGLWVSLKDYFSLKDFIYIDEALGLIHAVLPYASCSGSISLALGS